MSETEANYRDVACPNCGRNRVELDGVCDKCLWDIDGGNYASITRPAEYDVHGYIFVRGDENLILDAEEVG
jgi:ribosomal protein L37AE/L43A